MKTMMQAKTKKRAYWNISIGKKLLIILFSLGLAYGASAQRGGGHFAGGGGFHGGGFHGGGYAPRTYVGVGIGLGYGFGSWGYGYSPFGWYGPWGPWGMAYPPYYGYGAMPSRLALQIEDIKNDYNAQIKDVRHDKSVPRKERRERIDQLKHDRDAAVIDARKNYYYNSRRNYNGPQTYNGNEQPSNGQQPNNGQQPGNNNQQQNNNNKGSAPGNNNGTEQPEYNDKGSTGTGTK